jgi:hypothetical protein
LNCLSFSLALSITQRSLGTKAAVKIQIITITISISTSVKDLKEDFSIGKKAQKLKKATYD